MIKLRTLLKSILLLGFWFLLSGSMDWQHILVGIAVTILIMLFWRRPNEEKQTFSLKPVVFGIVLGSAMLVEILKSAWHVAWIILCNRPVNPEFVWVETPLQQPLSRVVFGNCISLTPGTLTVSLEGNRLLVHALTPEFGQGLTDWRIHKILKKMEGSA